MLLHFWQSAAVFQSCKLEAINIQNASVRPSLLKSSGGSRFSTGRQPWGYSLYPQIASPSNHIWPCIVIGPHIWLIYNLQVFPSKKNQGLLQGTNVTMQPLVVPYCDLHRLWFICLTGQCEKTQSVGPIAGHLVWNMAMPHSLLLKSQITSEASKVCGPNGAQHVEAYS